MHGMFAPACASRHVPPATRLHMQVGAQERFLRLKAAYEVLSDTRARAEYDAKSHSHSHRGGARGAPAAATAHRAGRQQYGYASSAGGGPRTASRARGVSFEDVEEMPAGGASGAGARKGAASGAAQEAEYASWASSETNYASSFQSSWESGRRKQGARPPHAKTHAHAHARGTHHGHGSHVNINLGSAHAAHIKWQYGPHAHASGSASRSHTGMGSAARRAAHAHHGHAHHAPRASGSARPQEEAAARPSGQQAGVNLVSACMHACAQPVPCRQACVSRTGSMPSFLLPACPPAQPSPARLPACLPWRSQQEGHAVMVVCAAAPSFLPLCVCACRRRCPAASRRRSCARCRRCLAGGWRWPAACRCGRCCGA